MGLSVTVAVPQGGGCTLIVFYTHRLGRYVWGQNLQFRYFFFEVGIYRKINMLGVRTFLWICFGITSKLNYFRVILVFVFV